MINIYCQCAMASLDNGVSRMWNKTSPDVFVCCNKHSEVSDVGQEPYGVKDLCSDHVLDFLVSKGRCNKFSVSRPGLKHICMRAGGPFPLFHYKIGNFKPLFAWHNRKKHA